MAELQIADVRAQVQLSLATDFENYAEFKPQSFREKSVDPMIDQVISWGTALKQVREKNS